MTKTYKVKFKEYDKIEEQLMEVKTSDIDFLVEQLHRNRSIESITVTEIKYPIYDEDLVGPNGNLGI
tara:strand:+ start:9463 stop:9663 length:201 start_codon:yes stop_codon:yes gene_type:complete